MESSRSFWTSVLILIVGIVLIFLQARTLDVIVTVLGVLFVATAVLNFVLLFSQNARRKAGTPAPSQSATVMSLVMSVAAAALGVWMLVDPAGLTSLLVYIFAGLMILGGAYLIISLAFAFRPFKFPGMFYVLPVLLVLTGVVVIALGAERTKDCIVLITGIAMIVYAVSTFIEAAGASAYRRSAATTPTKIPPTE